MLPFQVNCTFPWVFLKRFPGFSILSCAMCQIRKDREMKNMISRCIYCGGVPIGTLKEDLEIPSLPFMYVNSRGRRYGSPMTSLTLGLGEYFHKRTLSGSERTRGRGSVGPTPHLDISLFGCCGPKHQKKNNSPKTNPHLHNSPSLIFWSFMSSF